MCARGVDGVGDCGVDMDALIRGLIPADAARATER